MRTYVLNCRLYQRSALFVGAAVLALAGAGQAAAQAAGGAGASAGAEAPSTTLQEIVVTAEKRSETLQKTPISMMALTSQDLERRGVTSLVDLRSQTPALQIQPHPNSGATTEAFIRGVGFNDDQLTQDPSVAVYIDGVYVARSQGLAMDIADIERVEVLRGPQGSLYGRNAVGGAINFITTAPAFSKFGFKQDFSFGNFDRFRSKTSVNIPIGDSFAAQFAYLRVSQDGFVDNLGTGVHRFGDQDRQGYRVALRWAPTGSVDLRYTYDRSEIDDTPAFIAAVPLYPAEGTRPTAGSPLVSDLRPNDIVSQGHNLTATWDVSTSLTLKSITAYRELDNFTNENYLAGVLGPFPLQSNAGVLHENQFTQELQAVGDLFGSRLKYVAGLYYFDETGDGFDTTLTPIRQSTVGRSITVSNKAYAAYAQATWTPPILEDRLRLTVGLRQSRDVRGATLQTATQVGAASPTVVSPLGSGKRTFNNTSPSFVVAYDATSNVNLYGKVVKGYKTGGFNVRASSVARFNEGFSPETLTSFEIGAKTRWFENRLQFDIDGFVSDYKDIQVNVQSDPTNIALTDVLNAGKAKIQGIEAQLSARPIPALTFNLNYAYLDAHYDEIKNAAGVNVADTYAFIQAPQHSLDVNAEYRFPETRFGQPMLFVDYGWQAKKFASSADPRYIVPAFGLLNARLTLADIPSPSGSLRASLWAKNLTDKTYYAAHFNAGVPAAIYGEPRTFGIDLTYQY
jgi:iron complex outermembrane receptor protein